MTVSTKNIADNIREIIGLLGEDASRQGLAKTPERVEKAFRDFTQGYQEDLASLINNALYESDMDEMVIIKDIELYSLCEHHLLPFFGKCHVAYVPSGKVLGLSKIARIVDMFAKRFQIQEQLTKQIAECIAEVTEAKGVAVVIEAQHLCMMMRGVQKQNSSMTTSMMLGLFRGNARTRNEFLTLIRQ